MDSNLNQREVPVGKSVRINWVDAGPAVLANNLMVQRDESTVYMTFYQISPPVILADDETSRRQELEKLESVNALPVVKVAVPIQQFRSFVDALKGHLQ